MNITNTVRLEWSVADPVYPYQSMYEYTLEEIKLLDKNTMRQQQEDEYTAWLNALKSVEQGNVTSLDQQQETENIAQVDTLNNTEQV